MHPFRVLGEIWDAFGTIWGGIFVTIVPFCAQKDTSAHDTTFLKRDAKNWHKELHVCKQTQGYSQPCDRRHLVRYQKTQCKAREPEATTLPRCVHDTYVFRSAEHIRMNFSITLESGIRGHLKHIRYPVPTTLRLHTAVHVYARVHTSIYIHIQAGPGGTVCTQNGPTNTMQYDMTW